MRIATLLTTHFNKIARPTELNQDVRIEGHSPKYQWSSSITKTQTKRCWLLRPWPTVKTTLTWIVQRKWMQTLNLNRFQRKILSPKSKEEIVNWFLVCIYNEMVEDALRMLLIFLDWLYKAVRNDLQQSTTESSFGFLIFW